MEYLQKAALGAEHTTRKLAVNPLFLTDNNPECLQTHGADEHSAVKPVSETRGEILALSTSTFPRLLRVRILLKILLGSVDFSD